MLRQSETGFGTDIHKSTLSYPQGTSYYPQSGDNFLATKDCKTSGKEVRIRQEGEKRSIKDGNKTLEY